MDEEKNTEKHSSEEAIEEQARDQIGQQKIRVRMDESNIKTSYASGFRPMATAEEVMLDFGLNSTRMTGKKDVPIEVIFQANNRIILNYYTTKRLAIALAQLIRRYEDRFGELELNAAKRQVRKES